MAEKHTPYERAQLYGKGWRRGAGMLAIPENVRDDSDFNEGYADGRKAYGEAMTKARERLGAPPPSVLRSQSSLDIEQQEDARYFEGLMNEGPR
jgi:hypothetical protein